MCIRDRYTNSKSKIIGAVGVIGPTRLNYGRIVPIVDYTAQLIGKMISERNAWFYILIINMYFDFFKIKFLQEKFINKIWKILIWNPKTI